MGRQESPQLIERKTQVDTDAQETSRASKYYHTIHSNERNMHWGFNILYFLCAQRYQYVTQWNIFLHLNHSVKVGKLAFLCQMVCLLHQLLVCVASQCKTMQPSVVRRPVVGWVAGNKTYRYVKNLMCYKKITFLKAASKILLGALIAIAV